MANTQAHFGLRPIRHLTSGKYDGHTNEYTISASDTTAIYNGDLVMATADGDVTRATKGVTDAVGVAVGFEWTNSAGELVWQKYWTGETGASNIIVHVIDDPNVIFEIQADGSAWDATAKNANADFDPGTGSATTGLSGGHLDFASLATGTAQLRILRLVQDQENEYGAYAKFEVFINEHAYRITAGT
ncbi:MAG: hypothetical protein NXI16_01275 [Alphaproteobacteria bacterium]|nr:hypothetical protein [Alphaproteobacteria bacterium]